MKTKDEVLLALANLRDSFERALNKTKSNELKNIRIIKGRISAIDAAINDITQSGEYTISNGYLSTVSARIKIAGHNT